MDDITQGLSLLYEWGPIGVLLAIFLTKWSPNSVVKHEREATKMANRRADAEREINVEQAKVLGEVMRILEHQTSMIELTVKILEALPGGESMSQGTNKED